MPNFKVTVSKGTATYEINADNSDVALDIADEFYNQRDFETQEIQTAPGGKLYEDIANYEAILENASANYDYSSEELADITESLYKARHIEELWSELNKMPVNTKNNTLLAEWHGFRAGTSFKDIYQWFEKTFNISIGEDMYFVNKHQA